MKPYVMALMLLSLTGCASLHHVAPKRFQVEAGMMQTEYIGEADGKVYLLRKSAPLLGKNWSEEILFTETEGLSSEFLKQLQESKKKTSNQASEATR